MKQHLLWLLLVVGIVFQAEAQVTTSSMTGLVQDESNTSVAGATVRVTHAPSGTNYSTLTNAAGRYNIANMRVGGPYVVEVSYVGKAPVTYENIYLQLGAPHVLNVVFVDGATLIDEVYVTARSASDVNKTGASTNVGTAQLENLPQVSRSLTEFMRLTPQASGNSFAGRDGRYNNLQIDGANFNNGFGLSSNVLPGGNSQPISLDAIQELQVNIAPFDVTQSGFTGAGINAVTRSGTNQFEGSVYGYFTSDYLTGRKIKDNDPLAPENGTKSTYGFRVGGPIIKDKLFFFVNAERERATGANASGANLWRASTDGIANPAQNIARPIRTDLESVQSHLRNVWGYDPGRYEGYADDVTQGATKFLVRLDYNINDAHKLSVRYNQVVGKNDAIANGNSGPNPRSSFQRVSENSITFENGNYGFENIVRSVSAELNSNFSSQLSNQFLATYSRIQDKRSTPSDHLFPYVDIWDGGRGTGNNNYMSFGTELFSYNNDVVNDNYSFINNLTYILGKHTFTGGAAFEIQQFGNSYTRMGTSYYRYASVEDFLTTGTPGEIAPINFGLTYPYEGQDTYARVNFGLASLYVQDRYSVNDRLSLTLGLRAELPLYLNKLTANPAIDELELLGVDGQPRHYSSSTWPKSRVILSPRFGFNYDVLGDRSFIVRGGTGIFSGRVPFVWLTNMPTQAGVLQNTIELPAATVAPWIGNVTFQPQDPYYYVKNPPAGGENVFISSPSGGAPGTIALVDDNFKMPTVWRSSVGIDYKIPNTPVTLVADGLYTRDVNSIFQWNANHLASAHRMDNGTREYFQPGQQTVYNTNTGGVYVLSNTDTKGYSYSATIGATVSRFHNLSGSVYYTYSAAKEVSPNPGSSAGSVWTGQTINNPNDQFLHISSYAIPHRVVASVNYSFQNSSIGLYYSGSNDGRFSFINSADINRDGVVGDLIYFPSNTSDIPFVPFSVTLDGQAYNFSVADQVAAFDTFAGANGLEEYRGDYLPRNGFLFPWHNRFDLRWTQDLFHNVGGEGSKFQFTADLINVGNFLNKNWGISRAFDNNMNQLLTRMSQPDADGNYTVRMNHVIKVNEDTGVREAILSDTPFRDATGFGTTWSMQLGLRYTF